MLLSGGQILALQPPVPRILIPEPELFGCPRSAQGFLMDLFCALAAKHWGLWNCRVWRSNCLRVCNAQDSFMLMGHWTMVRFRALRCWWGFTFFLFFTGPKSGRQAMREITNYWKSTSCFPRHRGISCDELWKAVLVFTGTPRWNIVNWLDY